MNGRDHMKEMVDIAMEDLLCSKNREASSAGKLHILSLGKEASPFICSRLSDINVIDSSNIDLVINSIELLGYLGDSSATRTIIQVLRSEKAPNDLVFNDVMITSLIRISDPKGIAELVGDGTSHLIDGGFEDLEQRIVRIFKTISSEDLSRRFQSALLTLLNTEKDNDVRLRVLNIISSIDDPDSIDPLLELMMDSEPSVRREVVRMIFQRRAGEYSDHLRKALEDKDEEVQALAMYGLLLSDKTITMNDVKSFIFRIPSLDQRRSAVKEVESLMASYLLRYSDEAKPLLYEIIKEGDKGSKELADKLLRRIEK